MCAEMCAELASVILYYNASRSQFSPARRSRGLSASNIRRVWRYLDDSPLSNGMSLADCGFGRDSRYA
jgi:hypothetical protein